MPLCPRHCRRLAALFVTVLLVQPAPVRAVELKKPTVEAFDRYARAREALIEQELKNNDGFLWVDRLPEPQRAQVLAELKNGKEVKKGQKTYVVIERLHVKAADGKAMVAPDALIHHWIGTVFIPGASLKQAIALVQDYDRHATNYTPDVSASKTIQHSGNDFKIYMRFHKKKILTAVLDTWQDVHYNPLSDWRLHSRAISTRIQEVEDAGTPGEKLKPEGDDRGFMWRLYTYWHFDERDGGVYIQCEAISLSRDVPFVLGWLKDWITREARESLAFTLGRSRDLLMKQNASAPAKAN